MNIKVVVSTVSDGDMGVRPDQSNIDQATENRKIFLEKNNMTMQSTTRVAIHYDRKDFSRYRTVNKSDGGKGMLADSPIETADALVTTDINHALFLTIADCVGAAIFDPIKKVLMVSHLGRHNLEQHGGTASIKYLIDNFQSNPNDLRIWLTPAPGPDAYPLYSFDNRSLKDVTIEQLVTAGVDAGKINNDPSDTSTNDNYFSHSEFLKGRQVVDGRFAIIAMMTN